jgi:excinuclease UvrABC ATPase subunit
MATRKNIRIRNARVNNLKGVSVDIPLGKLVAVVGKSGSGKSSLVYDVIYRAAQGRAVEAVVSGVPKAHVLAQQVKTDGARSLGETSFGRLKKLAGQAATGELLIADEPGAGMSRHDRELVLAVLRGAVVRGVSVIMIEHARDLIAAADYVIEIGPQSGAQGGELIFRGPISQYRHALTSTSAYVFSNRVDSADRERRPSDKARLTRRKHLSIEGITKNNFRDYTLSFPLGSLVGVSGDMGKGKTTLLSVAYGALCKDKHAWRVRHGFRTVVGKANVRRSYFVDQSSLSSVATSTPATYLGIWSAIKKTLPKFPGLLVADVLDMTVDEAARRFSTVPLVVRKLGFLQEVGLGYLTLGQKSKTLSGGEAQRVRLAKILSKKLGDRCLYVLDTPSRGLHLCDLPALARVLRKIVDKNNTVLIAENREELIENCDYVISLGKQSTDEK